MTDPHQRCRYQCAIHDVEGEPEFVITVQDRGRPDYVIKSNSPMGRLPVLVKCWYVVDVDWIRFRRMVASFGADSGD